MSDVTNSMTLAEMEAYWVSVGEKKAEQRIIKLLEEMAKSTFPGDLWYINPFEYAIALIKGENK